MPPANVSCLKLYQTGNQAVMDERKQRYCALTICFIEGVRRASAGWRLGSERRELAVAFSKCVLPPVLQGLLPRGVRQEDGQKWRLHQVSMQCRKLPCKVQSGV